MRFKMVFWVMLGVPSMLVCAPAPTHTPPKKVAKDDCLYGTWTIHYGEGVGRITFNKDSTAVSYFPSFADEEDEYRAKWTKQGRDVLIVEEDGWCAAIPFDDTVKPKRFYTVKLNLKDVHKGVVTGTWRLDWRPPPLLPDQDDEIQESQWDQDFLNKEVVIKLIKPQP